VRVRSAGYHNIEKFYHAGDYGILIRDNTDTNKSAAPTKFAEYVNAGLNLLINVIEADYVQIFRERKLKGILLEKKDDLYACFDSITNLPAERNTVKVNILSELVQGQKRVLTTQPQYAF
jgi:hypothetical protein